MSMLGLYFHFRCSSCDATSDSYSVFPFRDVNRPDISLLAWSVAHKSWACIDLNLSADQRAHLDSDPEHLNAFASSLSSEKLTVCVPRLCSGENDSCDVSVSPDPICPLCGVKCLAVFGDPPAKAVPERIKIPELARAAFELTPLSMIELSVRSRNICGTLGISTLGQLREYRDRFADHKQATASSVSEVDRWIAVAKNTKL